MKFILLFLTFFINKSFSNDKEFLKCLGQEEKQYHTQRKSGALVNLNKKMISEFIQMSSTLDIKERFNNDICHHSKYPPSVSLLYIILHHQEKAFTLKADKKDITARSKDRKTINEVINMSFYGLIEFIDDLQTQFSKPNCILNEVPGVKDFYKKARYTLEDIGLKRMLAEIKDLKGIIDKLFSKDLLIKCQKNQKV